MIINRTARFKRAFKKLPLHIQKDFFKNIKIFMQDYKNPRLRTHKLRGQMEECYAFCLRDGFRVLFEFNGNNEINLIAIGPHDYYKRWSR